MKLGITKLIHNKDDIQFVTEFPCFFWDTLYLSWDLLSFLKFLFNLSNLTKLFWQFTSNLSEINYNQLLPRLVLLSVCFIYPLSGQYSTNWDRKGWPGSEIQMYYGCPCSAPTFGFIFKLLLYLRHYLFLNDHIQKQHFFRILKIDIFSQAN